MAVPIIHAADVGRTFGSGDRAVHALKQINISIPSGRLIVLKGRSGSGKTTLMNVLGALDRPTEGTVTFAGQTISAMSERERTVIRRKQVGFIFQNFALVPLMSAFENVQYGLKIAGISAREQKATAEEALGFVGLTPRMHHRPYELSGGEQQRVAVARAIAHRPQVIFADEPTAELDSRMGLQVMKLFRRMVQEDGRTVILTTHDPAVMELADQVYVLEDGQLVTTV